MVLKGQVSALTAVFCLSHLTFQLGEGSYIDYILLEGLRRNGYDPDPKRPP